MFWRQATNAPDQRQPYWRRSWPARLQQFGLAAIGVIALSLLAAMSDLIPVLATAERAALDVRLAIAGVMARAPEQRLVIIEIDQRSIDRTQRYSPIDRRFLAVLLDQLQRYRPAAIGLDVILDQPSDPDGDAALQQQLARMSVPVLLAYGGDEGDDVFEASWQARFTRAFARGSANVNVALASVQFPVDGDGVLRRLPRLEDRPPSMSRELARRVGAAATAQGRLQPITSRETSHFVTIPADVIAGAPEDLATTIGKVVRDRLVLVGVDLPDTDRHRTVGAALTGGTVPGVYVHAAALAQLLDDRVAPSANRVVVTLAAVVLVQAAWWLGLRWQHPLGVMSVIAVALALYALAATILVSAQQGLGFALPVVGPATAMVLAVGGGIAAARQKVIAERRRVSDALAHYVPAAVATDIISAPRLPGREGQKFEITALFTDVADFTRLAESLDPSRLAVVLNQYFDGMTKIIHRHGGTLDKFNGDGAIAFWGAPTPDPHQAQHAIACGLDLGRYAEDYAALCRAESIGFGRTRIGIHKGPAIVGNFGSEERFQYTAIGDTMNIAARLESANRHLGTRILVSAAVVEACPSQRFRPVASVVVQGRAQVLALYEPLDASEEVKAAQYAEAYALMAAGSERCVARFGELAIKYPDDGLIEFLARRCATREFSTTITLVEK